MFEFTVTDLVHEGKHVGGGSYNHSHRVRERREHGMTLI